MCQLPRTSARHLKSSFCPSPHLLFFVFTAASWRYALQFANDRAAFTIFAKGRDAKSHARQMNYESFMCFSFQRRSFPFFSRGLFYLSLISWTCQEHALLFTTVKCQLRDSLGSHKAMQEILFALSMIHCNFTGLWTLISLCLKDTWIRRMFIEGLGIVYTDLALGAKGGRSISMDAVTC